MRIRLLAAAAAALLVPAAPAFAGDPIMALSDVHAGMRCTGYSVVRGTEISSFDVEVLDVVDGVPAEGGPRILVQVSGPAVDSTGIAEGFSGSPIYCADGAGASRNIGAISEGTGEYGGKIALATPIEAIVGTPVDVPRKAGAGEAPAATARAGSARSAAFRRWERAVVARARPLAAPLTVSGVSGPVGRALVDAGRAAGRTVLAAPAGPLGSYPAQTLRPGSAVGVAYSTGDLRLGGVGTVAYVDGDRVWAFGHPFDNVGARALLLQDAYVFRVINNPLQLDGIAASYKLAAMGHDVGTLSSDGLSAVAGRLGRLPHTVPLSVNARDADRDVRRTLNVRVADEAAVDLPAGASPLTGVAPLAVVQAAAAALGSTPGRVSGEMCARIELMELDRPLRFCNRYVSTGQQQMQDESLGNAVTTGAASDLADALSQVDAYTGRPPHVTGVSVKLTLHRGADQAFLRRVRAPTRVRPGQRVRLRVTLQRVRGERFTRTYTVRIPIDARAGRLSLRLVGRDADQGDDALATTIVIGEDPDADGGGDAGPSSLAELAEAIHGVGRYDGVTLRAGDRRSRAFRDAELRISGRADATVLVVRR